MTDLYLYLDETGQLGMSGDAYYGLGQATFRSDMGNMAWEGAQLRFELEREGISLPKGFHAKDDTESTRSKVFDLIAHHKPRIDVTLVHKRHLPAPLKREVESNEINLYYWAWRKHFTYQAVYLLRPTHRVFVVASSVSEHSKKQKAAKAAIESVLKRYPRLDITLCIWNNPTSWGLQVADYGLWAVQRDLIRGSCGHFKTISPLIETVYSPWEEDGSWAEYRPAAESRKLGRPLPALIFNRHRRFDRSAHASVPPSIQHEEGHERFREDDSIPDDYYVIDDPLGYGLWGSSLWSDDEPWGEQPSDPKDRL